MKNHDMLMEKIIECGNLFQAATLINCVAVDMLNRELTAIPDQSLDACFCRKLSHCLKKEIDLDHVFHLCSEPVNIHKQLVYHCPFGLTNIIVPFISEGETVAALLAGPMLNKLPEIILDSIYEPEMEPFTDIFLEELRKYKILDTNQIIALSELLVSIMPRFFDNAENCDGVENKYSKIVQVALDYIHRHYNKKITLNDAAKATFVNPSYLSRIFNKEVKVSFTTYLNEYRIKKSKALLVNKNTNILEVCYLVGFDNQSYYNKIFKQSEGKTPGQFKKELSGVAD